MNVFQGKVAVITGAGSGIGRQLAVQLAAQGARLAISDINESGLQQTVAMCRAAQSQCEVRSYKLDVSSREQVFAHAEDVKRDFGSVHYLFNNAGVTLVGTIEHSSIEEFEWQLGINLWGVIYGVKAFLPIMLAQRAGHIVNISSIFGMIGFPGQGAYNVSKFGVRGLTECLWSELEGTGVQATTVHPGGIRTEIGAKARMCKLADEQEHKMLPLVDRMLITPPEECAANILRGVAQGKRKIVTGHKATLVDWLSRLVPVNYGGFVKRDMGV
ncbi:MAG: SDR family oxidoreductase [Burkholderiaceae bacterium]|nr:SDR family oxidoreductase [Burkholderiaceae bacterium]